jgi:hypothetical protein
MQMIFVDMELAPDFKATSIQIERPLQWQPMQVKTRE